jgi:hypothetical protein
MQDPAHYRLEARKFVEQAQNAKNSEHRSILLQEAQTMVRLAEQAEMMDKIISVQEGFRAEGA